MEGGPLAAADVIGPDGKVLAPLPPIAAAATAATVGGVGDGGGGGGSGGSGGGGGVGGGGGGGGGSSWLAAAAIYPTGTDGRLRAMLRPAALPASGGGGVGGSSGNIVGIPWVHLSDLVVPSAAALAARAYARPLFGSASVLSM